MNTWYHGVYGGCSVYPCVMWRFIFPGAREAVDVSGRSRAGPGAHLSRLDVHELRVRFQSHAAQAPVQRMWQGNTRSLTHLTLTHPQQYHKVFSVTDLKHCYRCEEIITIYTNHPGQKFTPPGS